jgi:hypothetical protein
MRTILVEEEDISTGQVNGVSSAQAGDWALVSLRSVASDSTDAILTSSTDDDDALRHFERRGWGMGGDGGGGEEERRGGTERRRSGLR